MLNYLKNCWEWICQSLTLGMAEIVQTIGVTIEQFALVVIMFGILLWFFKITKVFRVGVVSYLLGLIINILGILIAA